MFALAQVRGSDKVQPMTRSSRCRGKIPQSSGFWRSALFLAAFGGLLLIAAAQAQVTPLVRLHAHNDYQHTRPLLDALDRGFCSVEADIYLVDGQLLVAHDRDQVKPGRTLQVLYLDPLRELVERNGGRVYPNGPEFTLLVELKGAWQTDYPVLRSVLLEYRKMLTSFHEHTTTNNGVRVIITGHRARSMFAGEPVRYAAMDGDLADLDSNDSPDLVPWISSNWRASFTWRGTGAFPGGERAKLKDIVARAHQHGRRVRFWGAPDNPVFWGEMLADDVDLINTDDLAGAQQFLLKQ